MAQIRVKNLSFSYPGSYDEVFSAVSFSIDSNWKLGFTGRNGRGKTTFLRLLMGHYDYRGSIECPLRFDYFPFDISDADCTLIDVMLNQFPDLEAWRIKRELSLLGFDSDALYQLYSTLSHGEQSKVMLAALFAREHNFLLIDEPTNHLDSDGRKAVADYLDGKQGYILVSHDRQFLDRCVDHMLVINKSTISVEQGNFSSWQQNKQYRDQFELAENTKLQRQIADLHVAAARTAQWSDRVEATKIGGGPCDRGAIGAKSAKMMQRAKSIERRMQRAIDDKSQLLHDIDTSFPLHFRPEPYFRNCLISAEKLQLSYDDTLINQPLDFSICSGDRVALTGANGAGKSSVIKLILGQAIAHTGKLAVGSQLKIAYVSQNTAHLNGDLRSYIRAHQLDEGEFKSMLHKLDFSAVQYDKPIEDFSEGQKKKLLIAKSLMAGAHLYIWDEPLNYIDVISRIQIEEAIMRSQPTMIFVEHDLAFVERVKTKQVIVERYNR